MNDRLKKSLVALLAIPFLMGNCPAPHHVEETLNDVNLVGDLVFVKSEDENTDIYNATIQNNSDGYFIPHFNNFYIGNDYVGGFEYNSYNIPVIAPGETKTLEAFIQKDVNPKDCTFTNNGYKTQLSGYNNIENYSIKIEKGTYDYGDFEDFYSVQFTINFEEDTKYEDGFAAIYCIEINGIEEYFLDEFSGYSYFELRFDHEVFESDFRLIKEKSTFYDFDFVCSSGKAMGIIIAIIGIILLVAGLGFLTLVVGSIVFLTTRIVNMVKNNDKSEQSKIKNKTDNSDDRTIKRKKIK